MQTTVLRGYCPQEESPMNNICWWWNCDEAVEFPAVFWSRSIQSARASINEDDWYNQVLLDENILEWSQESEEMQIIIQDMIKYSEALLRNAGIDIVVFLILVLCLMTAAVIFLIVKELKSSILEYNKSCTICKVW